MEDVEVPDAEENELAGVDEVVDGGNEGGGFGGRCIHAHAPTGATETTVLLVSDSNVE